MAELLHKRILVVEDDSSLLSIAEYQLSEAGYEVKGLSSGEEAMNELPSFAPHIVLLDLVLKGPLDGSEVLKRIKVRSVDLPVIIMTANGSIGSAVECMKRGAWDYLTKPFRWNEMLPVIEKALRYSDLAMENLRLRQLLGGHEGFDSIIGRSSSMIALKKQLPRIAVSDAPVLIFGESGTGKELVARSIHLNSPRRASPFMPVNCGAIVRDLAASEIFGHVKGAFTGAAFNKKGYFEEAESGTLFLDEIGELAPDLQVKLLRVLQEGRVMPVGSSKEILVDVRIIAATNVDLEEAVRQGEFREDLYYRLAVLPLSIPSLRDRKDDLEELFSFFMARHGQAKAVFSPELIDALKAHRWPGNVRELENLVRRLIVMNPDRNSFCKEDLPRDFEYRKEPKPVPYEIPEEGLNLEEFSKQLLESALARTGGNQTKAAKLLGITRSSLIYRMQKYGMG